MYTASPIRPFFRPTPIVAIHSSASSPRQWNGYAEWLDPAAPLHTPCLLGYESDQQWTNGSPVTLEAEAEHVLPEVRAQHGVHLVAHSYGGAVAIQAALLRPGLVRSLTLYEPSAFHLLEQDEGSAAHAGEIRAVAGRVALFTLSGRHFEAAQLFVDYWSAPGAWAGMAPTRRADVARRMTKVRAEFGALFHSRMDVSQLHQAGIPVRIVRGEDSPAPARRVAELLHRKLPQSELLSMPGLRHMAPLVNRAELAPLLFPHSLRVEERLAA
ncbi:alpha/beta hydrolase [Ramlibacter henchirensis]|uniref:Alpha/beta hydrolase n=1 Tax=Ramlibacter henchirensis TaxID=204072 RepID=A0A4Z0C3T4_9BURK|nr:alpha/beta hydrolase [Ramlibacter henchirensis]TFZ05504.1 alpha/beta hydrolase [Ramlibacter henchirensis]